MRNKCMLERDISMMLQLFSTGMMRGGLFSHRDLRRQQPLWQLMLATNAKSGLMRREGRQYGTAIW